MPIYEYFCSHCNKEFEKLVRLSDKETIVCPNCDSAKVKKKMSAVTIPGSDRCGSTGARPFS